MPPDPPGRDSAPASGSRRAQARARQHAASRITHGDPDRDAVDERTVRPLDAERRGSQDLRAQLFAPTCWPQHRAPT